MNCYNGEKFLTKSIESVLRQKYKNWELIFWDNRSTDRTKKIIKSYKDKRIKYFFAKKFTNLYKARNLAIQKAKGEYITFLDTDDLYLRDKLFLQVKKIKEKKCSVIYSNCYLLNNKTIQKKKKLSNCLLPEGNITNKLIENFQVALATLLIKKKVLEKNPFNGKLNIVGDRELVLNLSLKENFFCVQSPLTIYRIHNNNYSRKKQFEEIRELELSTLNFKKKYIKSKNYNKKIIDNLINKVEVKKKLITYKNLQKKIFVLNNLIFDFNRFNYMNFIKTFTPNFIRSKFLFFNW